MKNPKPKKANKPRAFPKPWSESEAKFRATFQECKKIKRGCKWCTQDNPTCCKDFEANQHRLRIWRDEMRHTSSLRQNVEVLLIFGSESNNKFESSAQPNIKPTENDETSDATQHTSLSPESDRAEGPGGSQQDSRPSLKKKFQRTESESEGESQATSLSSQSSVCTSPSPKRRKRCGPPRVYRKQRRTGKASRSIDLTNIIFPSGMPKVCRRRAQHFLGLSEQRIRRVCDDIPDGRTRGHRLPNSHPAFAPQLTTCMRFLNHCWHFFAEGLPDKFSMAKGDGCSKRLTLGTSEPTRSTRMELESDTEDSGEEDERSLSALALHIHSAEEAGTGALRCPAVAGAGAPCRYIGVMRPVALFHLLGEWCGHRNLTCPGFSTLLRALVDAKAFLKFRKSAGQHANCEVCVEFKKALKKFLTVWRRQEILEAYCRRSGF